MHRYPDHARPVAAAVAARLAKILRRLPEGTRLPPERRLCADLGCSRSTLRAVLLRLEQDGRIWRHVGQGTFVGRRAAGETVKPDVLLEQVAPAELMGARLVLEPVIAAAAARAASPEAVERLRSLALQTVAAQDWRAYEAADEAFHRAIAAATGNRMLGVTLGLLSSVRRRLRWQRQHDRAFRAAREREYSRTQGALHLALVEAIGAGDPDRAEAIMRDHLEQISVLMTT